LDDVGKPKATIVTEMMIEMNPDVKGQALIMSIDEFISKN
jgi:molybdopterin/thiamine biosynthesis adenylyltransferase